MSATCQRGEEDQLLPLADSGVQAVAGAHVLAADVLVLEGSVLAVLEQLRAERRVALDEVVQHLADGSPFGSELAHAADLGARILDNGGVAPFVNVYVGGEDVRTREGLETLVDESSTVILLPAMAGG